MQTIYPLALIKAAVAFPLIYYYPTSPIIILCNSSLVREFIEQKKQLELSVAGLEIRAIAIIWKTLYSWALIAIDKYKYTYFV